MPSIDFSDRQTALVLDQRLAVQAADAILCDAGFCDAELSIAVVDDPTIHALNRQYLAHDYPTDVLSFVLQRDAESLEGEVIVSADTALRRAGEFGWTAAEELLLYVIHGTLHLVGHDDATIDQRAAMRDLEEHYLTLVGVQPGSRSLSARVTDEGASNAES